MFNYIIFANLHYQKDIWDQKLTDYMFRLGWEG